MSGRRARPNPPPVGGARDRAQERGLAGAVGADDADDLASANRKAHVAQRLQLAMADGEVTDLEQRVHWLLSSSVPR